MINAKDIRTKEGANFTAEAITNTLFKIYIITKIDFVNEKVKDFDDISGMDEVSLKVVIWEIVTDKIFGMDNNFKGMSKANHVLKGEAITMKVRGISNKIAMTILINWLLGFTGETIVCKVILESEDVMAGAVYENEKAAETRTTYKRA